MYGTFLVDGWKRVAAAVALPVETFPFAVVTVEVVLLFPLLFLSPLQELSSFFPLDFQQLTSKKKSAFQPVSAVAAASAVVATLLHDVPSPTFEPCRSFRSRWPRRGRGGSSRVS